MNPEFTPNAENCMTDERGIISKSFGYTSRADTENGTTATTVDYIKGAYEYRKSIGTKHLIVHTHLSGGTTELITSTDGITFADGVTGLDADAEMSFATIEDELYCMNGVDDCYNFDGTNWKCMDGTGDPDIPLAKYCCVHQDLLFIANISTAGSAIQWNSVDYAPDYDPEGTSWPATNVIEFDPDDNEDITGIVSFNGHLVIFKKSKFYGLFGDNFGDPSTLFKKRFDYGTGCIFQRSIIIAPGEGGKEQFLYFMDKAGYYRMGADLLPKRISDPVINLFNDISQADISYGNWLQTTKTNWEAGTYDADAFDTASTSGDLVQDKMSNKTDDWDNASASDDIDLTTETDNVILDTVDDDSVSKPTNIASDGTASGNDDPDNVIDADTATESDLSYTEQNTVTFSAAKKVNKLKVYAAGNEGIITTMAGASASGCESDDAYLNDGVNVDNTDYCAKCNTLNNPTITFAATTVIDQISLRGKIRSPYGHMGYKLQYQDISDNWHDISGATGTITSSFGSDTHTFTAITAKAIRLVDIEASYFRYYITEMEALADGSSAYQLAYYDTSWHNIGSAQVVNGTDQYYTHTFNAVSATKFRITNDAYNDLEVGEFEIYEAGYEADGYITTYSWDYSEAAPTEMGQIAAKIDKPTGTGVVIKAQSSDSSTFASGNGTERTLTLAWGNNEIVNADLDVDSVDKKRYLRVKVEMTPNSDYDATPELKELWLPSVYISAVGDATASISAFRKCLLDETKPEDTYITYYVRGKASSPPDGAWAVIQNNEVPDFTPDLRYIQFKIVIEKTKWNAGTVSVQNFEFNWRSSTTLTQTTVASIVKNNRLFLAFTEGEDTYNNTLLIHDKRDNFQKWTSYPIACFVIFKDTIWIGDSNDKYMYQFKKDIHTVYDAAITAFWEFPSINLRKEGFENRIKRFRQITINYETQPSGTLNVYYSTDGKSTWSSAHAITMSTAGPNIWNLPLGVVAKKLDIKIENSDDDTNFGFIDMTVKGQVMEARRR